MNGAAAAMGRVSPLQGEVERVDLRTRQSKSFARPDGSIRVVNRMYPVHYDNNGQWVEVDDSLITNDGGVTWRTADTSYNLQWESDTCTLSYQSKRGGDFVRIRLMQLDGVPVVTPFPKPTVTGRSIKALIAPDLEIELRIRANGVEIYKTLLGPLAPTSLTWRVLEGDSSRIAFDLMNTSGIDNLTFSALRSGEVQRRRRIEITHSRTPDDTTTFPGKNTYFVTETFTGRTRFIDPNTFARSWLNEVVYPVEIDVTVVDHITANTDDGYGSTGPAYWLQVQTYTKLAKAAAWRFLAVNVPQGTTLTSAIITVNVTASSGAASATMAGENVDSASLWANMSANSPLNMAATTATISVATPALGTRTIDVTTLAQEIVNRAGWAANNNMRFGFTNVSAMGASYWRAEDYNAVGTAEAFITIIYTAAVAVARGIDLLNNGDHPGASPGNAGISGRFMMNWWPYSATTDVTVALTGVSGTGAVGSVGVAFDLAQTGVSGTSAVGSVALGISASISGNAGTGSVGSVAITNSLTLTGAASTGSIGSIGLTNSPALVGVGGAGSVGTVSPLSGVPLAGSTATGSVGTLALSFDLALTGNEGTSAVGTISVAAAADVTVAISGVEATSAVGTPTASSVSGSVEVFSGGYFDYPRARRRTPEDIKRERIELGILPPEEERRAEAAIELAIESAVAISLAKPDTQAATDALKSQQRAQDLFIQAYLAVYPALEEQRILDALRLEAHRLVLLQEEEFAIVLSLL